MVSEVVDARTIKVTHANWSPINGSRGQVEEDVEVVDVSEANDWSEVRVWYAPLADIGMFNVIDLFATFAGKPEWAEDERFKTNPARVRNRPGRGVTTVKSKTGLSSSGW